MKKIYILFSALLLNLVSFSQKDKKCEGDTTRFKIGDATVIIVDSKKDGELHFNCDSLSKDSSKSDKKQEDWNTFLDLGTTGYLTPNYEITLPKDQELMALDYSKSWTIGFSSLYMGANIKDRVYIAPGLGIIWHNYHFKNTINISTSNSETAFSTDSIKDYTKYKLGVTYIQAPLIVGMRLGDLKKPIGLQFGVVGNYKVGSKVRQKYKLDGKRYNEKIKDDFNLSPFKLDAIARLSMKDFGFFARYSFTPMFEKGKTPEINQFSLGITFGEFTN